MGLRSTATTTARATDTTVTPATVVLTGDLIIMASGTTKEAVSEAVKAVLIITLDTPNVDTSIVSITEGSPTTTARKHSLEEFQRNDEEGGRRLFANQYVVTWRATVPQARAETAKGELKSNEFKDALTEQLKDAGAANVMVVIDGGVTTSAPLFLGVAASKVKSTSSLLLPIICFCTSLVGNPGLS